MLKSKLNNGKSVNLYYWRDNKGVEIDLLIDAGQKLVPVEIKSTQTFQEEHLSALEQWKTFSGVKGGVLLYDGSIEFKKTNGVKIQNWRTVNDLKWP